MAVWCIVYILILLSYTFQKLLLKSLNFVCANYTVMLSWQILGLDMLLGSQKLWPLLLGLTVLPAVLQTIMLLFCSESPRYLLINLQEEDKARQGKRLHSPLESNHSFIPN